MQIWKNTNILDPFLKNYIITEDKKDAEIILLGSKKIDLEEFPKVKGVFRVGVGIDNVPLQQLMNRNIELKITSEKTNEIIYEETSNFTCYLLFQMMFAGYGTIDPWEIKFRDSFVTKNLLIIGTGNIGGRVVKKMKPFLNIITFDSLYNKPEELKHLLENSDFVSLNIPLNEKTRNLFNKEKLSWIKDGGILINNSRAALVSEDDLYTELKTGRIKAAFDVFWEKPYNGKLKEFYPYKFFMTPHVSSKTKEYLLSSANDFKNYLEEFNND